MTPAEHSLDEMLVGVYVKEVKTTEKGATTCHMRHSVSLRQIILAALNDPEIRKAVLETLKPVAD